MSGIDRKNPMDEINRRLDTDEERNCNQKTGQKKTKETAVWREKRKKFCRTCD